MNDLVTALLGSDEHRLFPVTLRHKACQSFLCVTLSLTAFSLSYAIGNT